MRTNRAVFVTGAAAGIGRTTALTFAARGCTVGGYDVGGYDVETKVLATGARFSPAWLTRLVNKRLAGA